MLDQVNHVILNLFHVKVSFNLKLVKQLKRGGI